MVGVSVAACTNAAAGRIAATRKPRGPQRFVSHGRARGSTVKARRNASMRELALVGRVRGGRGRVLSCPLSRVARAARPAFHESASDGGSGGGLGPDAGLGLRGRARSEERRGREEGA